MGQPVTVLDVRITPNARKCAVERAGDGRWRVRLDSPPVDGAANQRLVSWLARDVFGVARGAVRVVHGEKSRDKRLEIDLDAADVDARLAVAAQEDA